MSQGAMLKIKQIRSIIGHPAGQRATVAGLGLRKINQVREVPDNAAMRGMIKKVSHLVQLVK